MNISSIGIASIFDNFSRGLQTGRQLKQVRQENELEDVRRQGLDAAKKERESKVAGMVKMQGLPTLDASNAVAPEDVQNLDVQDASALPGQDRGQPTQPKFQVGDKSFGSKQEAEQYADTQAPPIDEIFYQKSGPKMRETLIAQGRLEEAQDWQKFMDDASTRKAMEGFRKIAKRRLLGDHEGAAKEFMKIYNSSYVNDGSKALGYEMKVGQDGSPGIAFTFEEDGKKFTRDFGPMEGFYELTMAEMAPQKMFDYVGKQIESERSARSEAATSALDHERKKELELMKQALKGNDVNNKYSAKVAILRNAGFSQTQINEMTPKILGAATERAGMSDVDIRAKALAALKDSLEFQGASEPEKKQMLSAMVDLIRGDSEDQSSASPAGGGGRRPVFKDANGNLFVRDADGSLQPVDGQGQPAPQQPAPSQPQQPQASANPAASGLPSQGPPAQEAAPDSRQLPPPGPPQIAGRRQPRTIPQTTGVGDLVDSAGQAIGDQRAQVAARERLKEAMGPAATRRDLQAREAKANQILSALGENATPEVIDMLIAFAEQEFGASGLAAFEPTPENLEKLARFLRARDQQIAQR